MLIGGRAGRTSGWLMGRYGGGSCGMLVMGLRPQPFLDRLEPSTHRFIARASVGTPGATLDESKLPVEVMPLPEKKTAAAASESSRALAALPAAALPSPRQ